MLQDLKISLAVAAGMLLLVQLLALTGIVHPPHELFVGIVNSPHWVFNTGSTLLHAFLLYAVYHISNWRRSLGALLTGAALDIVLLYFIPDHTLNRLVYWIGAMSAGPGLVGFALLLRGALHGPAERRRDYVLLLGALAVLVVYGLSIGPYLNLTAALHPATFDGAAYRVDASYGIEPAVIVSQLASTYYYLDRILLGSYHLLAYGFSIFYALQIRSQWRWPASAFMLTTVSGAIAMALYQICPISGPGYAFPEIFPFSMPPPEYIAVGAQVIDAAPRNGIPSMHFGWALLLWFNSRFLGAWVRRGYAVLLGLTALATIGLGEHYLIDLVAGVPAALAMQALCTRPLAWSHPVRRDAIFIGAALTLVWLLGVRFVPQVFISIPGLTWIVSIATVWISTVHFRRLAGAWAPRIEPEADASRPAALIPAASRQVSAIAAMFVVSGFAGLMYQVLFSKSLALTFGSTSTAMYTVLATYMGGMAIGAWLGGLLAEKRDDVLPLYGFCELGIGVFCLATPLVFAGIQGVYTLAASGIAPDAGVLTLFRLSLGALALLVPTVLMGMTLPLLAKFLGARAGSLGVSVAMLYGANTLGAAFGALLAGYMIIPLLGLLKTTMLAAVANLAVALIAFRLQKQWSTVAPAAPQPDVPLGAASSEAATRTLGILALGLLTVGGFVTLALEVNYVHLLAVVAGNSVYAFALMLFAFLLGLGAGAEAGRRLLKTALSLPVLLAGLELGLAATVLLSAFMWDALPEYFASFAGWPFMGQFGARELVRGVVCWLVMFPAAAFIGALYPIAMECIGRAFPRRRFAALGHAAALNTVGNIAGVLLAGFILLPTIGALRTVQVLAITSLALGIAVIVLSPLRRRAVAWVSVAAVGGLVVVQPATLDYTALSTGANVYFAKQAWGNALDHAESADGGLTTVTERTDEAGKRVLTLLTNGKFQGNDDVTGEMPAQVGFAVAPLLHTDARERALVIGYGTGVSARTLHEAGFKSVEIVELSADIVRMTDKHFKSVNAGVTGREGVKVHITDGRNFLMLQDRQYDLISMEISSIWFSGAASLYNREFYQLARQRLRPDGVLQQWIQLHHVEPVDILHILGSVRSEFRFVWLYFIGNQGIIVASNDPARTPSASRLDKLKHTASFAELLGILGEHADDALGALLLDPQDLDGFLGAFGVPATHWISTDDNSFLEYHTPKGNVLDGQGSMRANVELLLKHRSSSVAGEAEGKKLP